MRHVLESSSLCPVDPPAVTSARQQRRLNNAAAAAAAARHPAAGRPAASSSGSSTWRQRRQRAHAHPLASRLRPGDRARDGTGAGPAAAAALCAGGGGRRPSGRLRGGLPGREECVVGGRRAGQASRAGPWRCVLHDVLQDRGCGAAAHAVGRRVGSPAPPCCAAATPPPPLPCQTSTATWPSGWTGTRAWASPASTSWTPAATRRWTICWRRMCGCGTARRRRAATQADRRCAGGGPLLPAALQPAAAGAAGAHPARPLCCRRPHACAAVGPGGAPPGGQHERGGGGPGGHHLPLLCAALHAAAGLLGLPARLRRAAPVDGCVARRAGVHAWAGRRHWSGATRASALPFLRLPARCPAAAAPVCTCSLHRCGRVYCASQRRHPRRPARPAARLRAVRRGGPQLAHVWLGCARRSGRGGAGRREGRPGRCRVQPLQARLVAGGVPVRASERCQADPRLPATRLHCSPCRWAQEAAEQHAAGLHQVLRQGGARAGGWLPADRRSIRAALGGGRHLLQSQSQDVHQPLAPSFSHPQSPSHRPLQEEENRHIKTIGNMAFMTRTDGPHHALYAPGYYAGGRQLFLCRLQPVAVWKASVRLGWKARSTVEAQPPAASAAATCVTRLRVCC